MLIFTVLCHATNLQTGNMHSYEVDSYAAHGAAINRAQFLNRAPAPRNTMRVYRVIPHEKGTEVING